MHERKQENRLGAARSAGATPSDRPSALGCLRLMVSAWSKAAVSEWVVSVAQELYYRVGLQAAARRLRRNGVAPMCSPSFRSRNDQAWSVAIRGVITGALCPRGGHEMRARALAELLLARPTDPADAAVSAAQLAYGPVNDSRRQQ